MKCLLPVLNCLSTLRANPRSLHLEYIMIDSLQIAFCMEYRLILDWSYMFRVKVRWCKFCAHTHQWNTKTITTRRREVMSVRVHISMYSSGVWEREENHREKTPEWEDEQIPDNCRCVSFTMRKSGLCRFLRMWTAFVATEWAPAHQAREYSHGSLITYRLVLMLAAAYFLLLMKGHTTTHDIYVWCILYGVYLGSRMLTK